MVARATWPAVTPELAWGTVGRLAARFGFAPRPTQTVYEFAGALGDAVPVARSDLETVARAKVEVVYGRTRFSKDRMRIIREATATARGASCGCSSAADEGRERIRP